jgi:transketolase
MTYEERLIKIAETNDDVVVLTAENRVAIRTVPERLGPRFLDVGIAEQTMIGIAAGLGLRGRIPVVHALATFLTMRAFEFIRTDIGIPALPVKLIGGVPGFLSEANGPTHQALEDIALMRGIPSVHVFCPADRAELLSGLESVIDLPYPCYVRYNGLEAVIEHKQPFEFGVAEVLCDGFDVAILTYGFLLKEALVASELLEAQGISVRLINLRTLVPIDIQTVLRAVRETNLLVTFEDHFLTGGLFSIVSELLMRRGVACNCLPIALEDRWFKPSLLNQVLEHEAFTGKQLAARIVNRLKYQSRTSLPSVKPRFDLAAFSNLQ